MNRILLKNTGSADAGNDIYFPRLQVNKLGEIILATSKSISKKGGLTTGILVAKTADSKSISDIGQKFTDWEVCGELQDYDGEVVIILKNQDSGKKADETC